MPAPKPLPLYYTRTTYRERAVTREVTSIRIVVWDGTPSYSEPTVWFTWRLSADGTVGDANVCIDQTTRDLARSIRLAQRITKALPNKSRVEPRHVEAALAQLRAEKREWDDREPIVEGSFRPV